MSRHTAMEMTGMILSRSKKGEVKNEHGNELHERDESNADCR